MLRKRKHPGCVFKLSCLAKLFLWSSQSVTIVCRTRSQDCRQTPAPLNFILNKAISCHGNKTYINRQRRSLKLHWPEEYIWFHWLPNWHKGILWEKTNEETQEGAAWQEWGAEKENWPVGAAKTKDWSEKPFFPPMLE